MLCVYTCHYVMFILKCTFTIGLRMRVSFNVWFNILRRKTNIKTIRFSFSFIFMSLCFVNASILTSTLVLQCLYRRSLPWPLSMSEVNLNVK